MAEDQPEKVEHRIHLQHGTLCPSCGLEKLQIRGSNTGFCPGCKFQFVFGSSSSSQTPHSSQPVLNGLQPDPRVAHHSTNDPRVVFAPQHTILQQKQQALLNQQGSVMTKPTRAESDSSEPDHSEEEEIVHES
jgi:hypothetical protein